MEKNKNYGDLTAQRLRSLRERENLSLSNLARSFNEQYKDFKYSDKDEEKNIQLSESALKNFEVGDKPHTKRLACEGMGIKYLRCLADFYGVSADYLLGLSDFDAPDIELAKFQDRFGLDDHACSVLENIADLSAELKEDGDALTLSDFVNEIISASTIPAYDFVKAISDYLKCNLADVTSHHYHVAEDNENVIISAHEYALLSKERVKSEFASTIDHLWNKLCQERGVRPDLTYNYENHRKMIKERVQEWEREHADELKECDGVEHGET